MDYFKNNMNALKKFHPLVWDEVKSAGFLPGVVEVALSRKGLPVCIYTCGKRRIVLHSLYDPVKEAKKFVESKNIKPGADVVLYGFGNGYIVEEILNLISANDKITVFELNLGIFRKALETRDLTRIFSDKRFVIHAAYYKERILEVLKKALDKIIFGGGNLIIHRPSLETIPEAMLDLKNALTDFALGVDSIEHFKPQMEANIKINLEDTSGYLKVKDFFGRYRMPAIIVSAGPSLDKNIQLLHEAGNKALIICVGTALRPLIYRDIFPDFCVIIDPSPFVFEQVKNLSVDTPLIFLPTVNWKVVKCYTGPRIMGIQEGIDLSEEFKSTWGVLETGGSVATTALDVAIKFGANPVIFVGQDLAYTAHKTHATGTVHGDMAIDEDFCTVYLKAWGGAGKVTSSKNLSYYKRWMERRILRERDIVFINATEGGAHIEGAVDAYLKDVLSQLPVIRGV
ncbi:motility associated factor glycosyltransferase family protein [Thermoanaerobacterium sp. DL9XJH110]|uniref:motility associated factor glycosyltransferase family protein n=1 Tax=Thermoanaerobacterium sp. DL9XJH110 TaxID=3386643 RepID=UPI003BB77800